MTAAIFDKDELLEECEDDLEMLAKWVEIFDRDFKTRMPKLQAAVQAGDCETVMQEAHALKGGIGTFFAKAAYETAYKLELMGRDHEPPTSSRPFNSSKARFEV